MRWSVRVTDQVRDELEMVTRGGRGKEVELTGCPVTFCSRPDTFCSRSAAPERASRLPLSCDEKRGYSSTTSLRILL